MTVSFESPRMNLVITPLRKKHSIVENFCGGVLSLKSCPPVSSRNLFVRLNKRNSSSFPSLRVSSARFAVYTSLTALRVSNRVVKASLNLLPTISSVARSMASSANILRIREVLSAHFAASPSGRASTMSNHWCGSVFPGILCRNIRSHLETLWPFSPEKVGSSMDGVAMFPSRTITRWIKRKGRGYVRCIGIGVNNWLAVYE